MDVNQYLSVFIDESREHLQAMNDQLLELEQNPEDISIVQTIFRSAHTLKGMSATMGFEDIASLTHEMENVLDMIRNEKLAMSEHIFEVLFQAADALEAMVEDIVEGGSGTSDVQSLVAVLQQIVSGEEQVASKGQAEQSLTLDEFQLSVMQQSLASGMQVYQIEVELREDCVLKAARCFMVFGIMENSGEVIGSDPGVEDIEQEKFDQKFTVYLVSERDAAELQTEIANVSEVEQVSLVVVSEEMLIQVQESRREAAAASAAAPEKKAEEEPASKEASQVTGKSGASQEAPTARRNKPRSGQTSSANRTIRVDIDRLDVLMNLFSELLIDRVRLEQLAGEIGRAELSDTVEHMARVSADLQNIVLKLRMVQVDSVFNRFPRMIRDIAKSLDKKVELIITGADTELDRTVIDEIGDPLVHLLRNAIDHGLESTNERISAGKSETGTIQLSAFHSGSHVFIEIEDDGKGINRDKVLATAIKRNVVSADLAEKLSDEEVFRLLFAAGFSTADQISDLSGRGVGLDVVKSKIESLGGQVSVTSKLGQGTKFSVQLPLTLSIISAMLVRIGVEKFALPISSIVETVIVSRKEIRTVHGNQLVPYRDHVIPVIFLDEVLDIPVHEVSVDPSLEMVVIRKGEKLAAVVVDEFIGQQDIVLKSLGQYLAQLFAVSGATILGDGQVALILEPNDLIK